MQITKANIGDVLCLYQTGECIRIEDIVLNYIHYQREYGSHYATHEFTADALRVEDPVRIASFDRNYELGKALSAAELAAQRTMYDGFHSAEDVHEASVSLQHIHAQQKYLMDRLDKERFSLAPGTALAKAFLSQLYEMGSGSHDIFFGHKVENRSSGFNDFFVDGRHFSYEDCVKHLSAIKCRQVSRTSRLDDLISCAKQRVNKNPFTIHPVPATEHDHR